MKIDMTFSEYIILERSENFYFTSLEQMMKCRATLEEWFSDLYTEYKILYSLECTSKTYKYGY
jgi:hypothetical protein